MASAKDTVAMAKSQVGTAESPAYSNKQKYGAWAGMNGYAWCCYFLAWVFAQSGAASLFIDGRREGLCQNVYNWAKAKGYLVATSDLQVGDVVFMKFGSNSRFTDHIGIVSLIRSDGNIQTIEGNTSSGNQRDGGAVMERVRSRKTFVAAYRPRWGASSGTVAPTPAPTATYPAYPGTLIKRGAKGSYVRTWQQKMRDREWKIEVDGIFGPASEKIARQFQAEKGLAVDGIVGPDTWKATWTAAVTK